jgi:flagellar hook-length control protein FliK
LALHSIRNAAARATNLDGDITPAELPPGRVRFSDELGRETALAARADAKRGEAKETPRADGVASNARDRERHDVESEERRGAASGESSPQHESSPPKSIDGAKADSRSARAATKGKASRGRASVEKPATAPAPEGDDEVSLALAQLGLAIQSPPAPPPAPPPLDPAGTRVVASDSLAAGAISTKESTVATEGDAIAIPRLADQGGTEASEVSHALLSGLEKSAARDADSDPKLASASVAKETGAALELLGIAASHGAPAAARATAVDGAAARPPAAPQPPAADAADALPRVALAELPRALPALADELAPRLRFGRRGANWEVELRLDPPELGSLHIRFELHGESIRGAIHCEPRVERLLGPVLKELEEEMGRQGGNASFDLSRQAREEERGSPSSRPWRAEPFAAAAAAPLAPSERSDPSRLVDVTA